MDTNKAMGTKTIGVTEEVYDRLAAEKRDDESFTDTVARLIDQEGSDWRRGFGRYRGDGDRFDRVVTESSADRADGLAERHRGTLEAMGFELDADGTIVSKPDTDESR